MHFSANSDGKSQDMSWSPDSILSGTLLRYVRLVTRTVRLSSVCNVAP